MSPTERSRRHRERKAAAAAADLAAVPAGEPGPVATGLEQTLAAIGEPDPALAAAARHLAVTLDSSGAANAAVAAELRRTVGQMKADARLKGAGMAGKRPPSRLDALRQARAAQDARR